MEMAQQFQEEFGLNAVLDSSIIDQLKMFDGLFSIMVEDEAKRINLNNCFQGRCPEILAMLEALFACPAEKMFLEQKKVTGPELVYRIKDYIDQDKRAEASSGYSDENEPYGKRQPKVQAKNAPLDSIDELRLIEGWDEEIHAVFSPYLTAYPFVTPNTDRSKIKLNINTTSRSLLQCLLPEAKGSCEEKIAITLADRDRDGTPLAIPGVNMKDVLRDQLCYTGGGAGSGGDKSDWFGRSSEVYRLILEGSSGDSVKKIMAVVERVMPDPKKNEKSTFRILYWKLI
jgi:type II secretory pathway component PulK